MSAAERAYSAWKARNGSYVDLVRQQWLKDAMAAGARWRSARQRPALAGNSVSAALGIAGPSSQSIEGQANELR